MKRLIFLTTILTTLAVAAACGGSSKESGFVPISGNSEFVLGPNRVAVGLLDEKTNTPILEAPGTSLHLSFSFNDALQFERDAGFVWAIPNANGFWTAEVTFDQAGDWQTEAVLTRDGKDQAVKFNYTVIADSPVPTVGDEVPASDNPTVATQSNMKQISTDEDPDTSFYQVTVAQALQAAKPFVAVFATPAFCQTRFCGPVLDTVKSVSGAYNGRVNFIHIEPFQLDAEGQLVPAPEGGPTVVPAMEAWHLNSEPWVFIVGSDGKVVARFEGAASTDELTGAINQALGS